ncbi:hypothetical protein [Actinopolymorpha pittospori]
MVARLAELITRLEPSHGGKQGGGEEPGERELLDALAALRRLRDDLSRWEPVLIRAAREGGVTWTDIAQVLGLASRQAAERRYLRINPHASEDPDTTREQRVQAARDRRSADRAVAMWARDNAAGLRRLAGQVSPLLAQDPLQREHLDALDAALGDDDAAALIAPLTAAEPSLRADHPDLAEEITAIGQKTTGVRSADESRRNSGREQVTGSGPRE